MKKIKEMTLEYYKKLTSSNSYNYEMDMIYILVILNKDIYGNDTILDIFKVNGYIIPEDLILGKELNCYNPEISMDEILAFLREQSIPACGMSMTTQNYSDIVSSPCDSEYPWRGIETTFNMKNDKIIIYKEK